MHITQELLTQITREVEGKGFKSNHLGYYKSFENNDLIKYLEGFVFIRKRPVKTAFENNENNYENLMKMGEIQKNFGECGSHSPNRKSRNPYISRAFAMGSNSNMGSPNLNLTPCENGNRQNTLLDLLPSSNFDLFSSLRGIRDDKDSLLVGFDSEWYYTPNGVCRVCLSYQFSFTWGVWLYELIVLCDDGKPVSLEAVLARILDILEFESFRVDKYTYQRACVGFNAEGEPKWKKFATKEELVSSAHLIYPIFPEKDVCGNFVGFKPANFTIEQGHADGKLNKYAPASEREWLWSRAGDKFPKKHNITLVCHSGRVDLSMLKTRDVNGFLYRVSEIQGGTVSLRPTRLRLSTHLKSRYNGNYVYPVTLNFRDTMAQSPQGFKSLEALGRAIKLPKLDSDGLDKENMDVVLKNNPGLFFEYASRDAVITLLYVSSIYGYNKQIGVSLMSASTNSIIQILMTYLGCATREDYDKVGRGLKKVVKGSVKNPNGLGFLEESNKEPISALVGEVQSYAAQAYHGGLNASSFIGYIKKHTIDFDLQNAYPTAMAALEDIDYDDPIEQEFNDTYITLKPWYDRAIKGYNPATPIFARVKYEFPKDVKFPCIPHNVEGRLLSFMRFGFRENEDVVYASGPEIFLALQLGAKVYVQRGFKLNRLTRPDGLPSQSLAYAVKTLVDERGRAKEMFGKGSLEELILKIQVNSGYGKIAQNVVDKRTWSSARLEMEGLRESAITDPIKASLITSYVRALLYATMNEAHNKGFTIYSVTTDGFISDIPGVDTLERFDLYGFKPVTQNVRTFLVGKPDIWEAKHEQDEFYNLTTRGNMGWTVGSVNAHNSTKSGFKSGSIEDREWFLVSCLEREGRVRYNDVKWTTFKEMTKDRKLFSTVNVTRNVSMDFDMKRKPVKESFYTEKVTVGDRVYEVACFDTVAFDTIDEAVLYERKKKLCTVLRTEKHWEVFYDKLENNAHGRKIRAKDGIEWAKLLSCVMGARTGLWVIDELSDTETTVVEKIDWLNSLNLSRKKFKLSDWKNARRPERQVNALPVTEIQDFLEIMKAHDFKV